VSVADVLFGQATPTEPSLRNKIIAFITLQRVAVNIIFLPVILGAFALAGGRFDDPRLPFALIVAWLISATGNIINDIVDAERDKRKWPLRPLPNRLIPRSAAALYAGVIAGIAFMMAGLIFNWLSAAIILIVIALSYVYARYTRDKVGHLTIMLTAAFIPVAVWTAISPGTLFTPLFWLAITLGALGAALINIVNETFDPEVKTFFIRLKPFTEMMLYVIFIIAMFFLGAAIFFYEKLPWSYLLVLTVITGWGLTAAKYLGEQRSLENLKKGFMIMVTYTTTYFLSIAIFVWIA
jgi:4-hydroxybenzoate polyprenyltransferase